MNKILHLHIIYYLKHNGWEKWVNFILIKENKIQISSTNYDENIEWVNWQKYIEYPIKVFEEKEVMWIS